MKPTIHILTAVHNDLPNLKKLIRSIKNQTYSDYTVTVVDDGSIDGVDSYLKDNHSSITYLQGNGKLWWTGSINLGLQSILAQAKDSEYILTINNDCTFDNNYLSSILAQADSRTIIGSKIVDSKTSKTWDIGAIIDWPRGKVLSRKSKTDRLDALATKGTLFPVKVFHKIGFLAKQLPHYISDYELSIRARQRGYRLKICDNCIVYNDTTNTGFGDQLPRRVSYRQVFQLLFGRRSKLNAIDHFWFITLSCPTKYKLQNYLRLVVKTVYLLVLPIPPLHHLLISIRKAYNAKV